MSHGRSGYVGGCRCDACRQGHRDYMREYMRRRKAAEGVFPGGRLAVCAQCGAEFPTRHGARSCSRACYGASMDAGVGSRKKVSKRLRASIYERDAWVCHICGDPVNRQAVVPELDAPTLDHVVALAVGGAHHEDNLRTAHFYCNSVKREFPLDQIA